MIKEDLQKFKGSTEKFSKELKSFADWITDHPEISTEEKETSEYIVRYLRDKGYIVEVPFCNVPYSFKAVKSGKIENKPKVAILCEYDALPEMGHACGHSLSCAISVLTALAMEDAFSDFPFQLDLIGTPDEELTGAKGMMAEEGGFDEYEFAIMAHMGPVNIVYERALACNDLLVTFRGQSAHASEAPWLGKNALNATLLFMHALDMMRQHLEPNCQIHGVIQNGGAVTSIVPDESTSYFNPRAGSVKSLRTLNEKMENCAKGAAIATETTYEIKQLYRIFYDVFNSPQSIAVAENVFKELGLPYSMKPFPSGSTDLGNVDAVIPIFQPYIAVGDGVTETHNPGFTKFIREDKAIDSLINGANVLCGILCSLAFDPDSWNEIKRIHHEYRESQAE